MSIVLSNIIFIQRRQIKQCNLYDPPIENYPKVLNNKHSFYNLIILLFLDYRNNDEFYKVITQK